MIDTNPIGARRFQNQNLNGNTPLELTQLLQKMGPIQAQDYEMTLWAIGLRTGLKRETLQESVLAGKIIRTHLLRPTWHLVKADQIYDLLAISAPNIKNSLRSRHAKLGIDAAIVEQSNTVIRSVLQGRKHLSRQEIKPHLLSAGLDLSENRFYHLLLRAALEGLICGGVPKGKEQTYTLLAELLPPQPPKSEAEILCDLATYYFESRGPARLKDFSWWAGLKQKPAKQALASISKILQTIELEGETYYQCSDQPELQADESVYFLPAYDEFIIAYQDKSRLLRNAENLPHIAKSGVFYPMIVHRGWIIGKWKARLVKETMLIEYQLFDTTSQPTQAQLTAGIESYSHFMERPIRLQNVK